MDLAQPTPLIIYKYYKITCSYKNLDTIKYNFNKWDFEQISWEYTDKCSATIKIREDQVAEFVENAKMLYEYNLLGKI